MSGERCEERVFSDLQQDNKKKETTERFLDIMVVAVTASKNGVLRDEDDEVERK